MAEWKKYEKMMVPMPFKMDDNWGYPHDLGNHHDAPPVSGYQTLPRPCCDAEGHTGHPEHFGKGGDLNSESSVNRQWIMVHLIIWRFKMTNKIHKY